MHTTRETRDIPLTDILEPSHRLRETINPEQLGELADSMSASGLRQPIGLRGPLDGDLWEIIWGHRRYLAAVLLKWPTIEAKLYPATYDPLLAAVEENLQRTDLTPMEEAHAVQRFIDRGQPEAAIARLFRRSPAWIRDRLDLLSLPHELQAAIHTGALALAVARPLADIDHTDYRHALIEEATRTGATARVVEVWRAHYLADRERIINNQLVVAEIAQRREAWKIYVPCDLCREDHEYPQTRALRVCQPCLHELNRMIEAAAQSAP